MADQQPKKKPIKLEWQGGIAEASTSGPGFVDAVKVNVKTPPQKAKATSESFQVKVSRETFQAKVSGDSWKGKVKARREVKGRGGKPVSVLFQFMPSANALQLKELCRKLKENLACGGSVEGNEVLVQVDDFARVQQILMKFEISCTAAGGF